LGDGEANEEDAEGDEGGDGSAASVDVHGLWGKYSGAAGQRVTSQLVSGLASQLVWLA
jgi:hypothetical protein